MFQLSHGITSNKEHNWTSVNIWMFSITIEHKSSCDTFFLNILQKHFQLPILGTLDMSGHFHQKPECQLWCLSACKKWTPSLTSFLRYCKDIADLLLWVLWECLIMSINNDSVLLQRILKSKVLKSTCRKLACWSVLKKSTSSLTWHCKDFANLPFWELRKCLFSPSKL